MEMDKRVDSLESEFRLMKGELKQTLTSVRDYLLNLKLPPSQEAALLAAAMSGGGADVSLDGKFSIEKPEDLLKPQGDDLPEDATKEEEGETMEPEAELAEEEAAPMDIEETAESKESEEIENAAVEAAQSVPPVNLLANLIRWVSTAKREIGGEQLPTFLEVYGITGHLSPELKETILHLADVAAAEPADGGAAGVWSQLILELHGILAGDDVPEHPLRPCWNNSGGESAQSEEMKESESEQKPMKLKLVFSAGDGKDKEFSVDLKPDE